MRPSRITRVPSRPADFKIKLSNNPTGKGSVYAEIGLAYKFLIVYMQSYGRLCEGHTCIVTSVMVRFIKLTLDFL